MIDEPMSLSDAVIGLKAYREVEQRMNELWHGIDQAIVGPRLSIESGTLPAIHVEDVGVYAFGISFYTHC
jgi:centromere/kinetochore protein ZW10